MFFVLRIKILAIAGQLGFPLHWFTNEFACSCFRVLGQGKCARPMPCRQRGTRVPSANSRHPAPHPNRFLSSLASPRLLPRCAWPRPDLPVICPGFRIEKLRMASKLGRPSSISHCRNACCCKFYSGILISGCHLKVQGTMALTKTFLPSSYSRTKELKETTSNGSLGLSQEREAAIVPQIHHLSPACQPMIVFVNRFNYM